MSEIEWIVSEDLSAETSEGLRYNLQLMTDSIGNWEAWDTETMNRVAHGSERSQADATKVAEFWYWQYCQDGDD